jgi:hypothetical protein
MTEDEAEAAAAYAVDPKYKVAYVVPHPPQNLADASPFSGYTPGLVDSAIALWHVAALPCDLRELYVSAQVALSHRMAGHIWPQVVPISTNALTVTIDTMLTPFVVCVSTTPEMAELVDSLAQTLEPPILHASQVPGPKRLPLKQLNRRSISKYVGKVVLWLGEHESTQAFAGEVSASIAAAPQRKERKHPLALGRHNVVIPNEQALVAIGYRFTRSKLISKPFTYAGKRDPLDYVRGICEKFDAVFAERGKLAKDFPAGYIDNRLILALASHHWGHFKLWRETVQKAPPEHRKSIDRAMRAVVKRETYFQTVPLDHENKPEFDVLYAQVNNVLASEHRAFTAGVAMMTCPTLCPFLRLEPKLHRIRGDLKTLANCVREEEKQKRPHYHWKVARLTRDLGTKMRALIQPEFLKRVDAPETVSIEGLKLVSDLPLELRPSNGIPLGMRFDLSRVSPMPGNLFLQVASMPSLVLGEDAFYDILVVRSFVATDPLRNVLERALNEFASFASFERVRYRFVDVETADEFVAAVTSHQGAVMIFDGHGTYDATSGIGSLVVGGAPLDAWALKGRCSLPPVVLLSACDTMPLDGSHGSVAMSCFPLGACCVLATLFPIAGYPAAFFLGRLLLRLDQYLPAAVRTFPATTVRHVLSGMLRMVHTHESARVLNKRAHLGLPDEAIDRIQLAANKAITERSGSWHERWLMAFGKEAGRTPDDLAALLAQHVGLTEAMRYIQLGNPERVVIKATPTSA